MNDASPHTATRRVAPAGAKWSTAVRWGTAVVFVLFGAAKFLNHGSELASFRHYALPAPQVWVYGIGLLELAGGLLLVSGRLTRLAALALAADMVGAIVVSGFGRGELISLTLAPVLLVALIFLIVEALAPDGGRRAHPGHPRQLRGTR